RGKSIDLHRGGGEAADGVALEAAGHRRAYRGDHEGDALPLEGVEPHDGGRLLVVTDGPKVGAHPRMQDLPGDEEGGQGQAEEEVVVRRRVRSSEEQGRLQAEIAAGDL